MWCRKEERSVCPECQRVRNEHLRKWCIRRAYFKARNIIQERPSIVLLLIVLMTAQFLPPLILLLPFFLLRIQRNMLLEGNIFRAAISLPYSSLAMTAGAIILILIGFVCAIPIFIVLYVLKFSRPATSTAICVFGDCWYLLAGIIGIFVIQGIAIIFYDAWHVYESLLKKALLFLALLAAFCISLYLLLYVILLGAGSSSAPSSLPFKLKF